MEMVNTLCCIYLTLKHSTDVSMMVVDVAVSNWRETDSCVGRTVNDLFVNEWLKAR